MKKLLIVLILFLPIQGLTHDLYSSYREDNKCYGNIYKEKYIKGNAKRNGYVLKWNETKRIPCRHHVNRVDVVFINKNKYKKFLKEKFISISKWFNRKFEDYKLNQSIDYKK